MQACHLLTKINQDLVGHMNTQHDLAGPIDPEGLGMAQKDPARLVIFNQTWWSVGVARWP